MLDFFPGQYYYSLILSNQATVVFHIEIHLILTLLTSICEKFYESNACSRLHSFTLFQLIVACLSHVIRALHQDIDHLGDLLQSRQHNLVAIHKSITLVLYLRLGTEVPDQSLRLA